MRRILLFMAVTIAASAAAIAVASPSTARATQTYKWFVPSAVAVAGPNHTFTLQVSVTNMQQREPYLQVWPFPHTGSITVKLLGNGFGQGYQVPSIGNITLKPVPFMGNTWTYTLRGYGLVGKLIGIQIDAVHVNLPGQIEPEAVSYTHLTLPTNREV